jgi:predicted nucleic acid-binding protein
MRPVLVDSNAVLDVAYRDPRWGPWSRAMMTEAASESVLVINPIVFAEVSIGYASVEDLEEVVPTDVFRREPLPFEAAFLAGKCVSSPTVGAAELEPHPCRTSMSAHAAVRGYRLLTRDATRYRTYFPTVELIAP